jgi:hypothetical protein
MGQLLFPTDKSIKGPWLISKNDLEELDKIIGKIESQLEESLDIEVRESILAKENNDISPDDIKKKVESAKKEYEFRKRVKTFILRLSDGTKLKEEVSLKGILKDNTVNGLKPVGLYIYMEYGYNNSLKIDTNNFGNEFSYDLKCYDNNLRSEIEFELGKWIEKRMPNKILQFWTNWGVAFIPPVLGLIVLFIFLTFSNDYSSYKETLVSESQALLKTGINSNNRDKAVELLLKIQTNYTPDNFIPKEKVKSPLVYKLDALILFFTIIVFIRPKTTLELGRSKLKFRFYKIWIGFVTITIPSILIAAPLWDKIINWLYK